MKTRCKISLEFRLGHVGWNNLEGCGSKESFQVRTLDVKTHLLLFFIKARYFNCHKILILHINAAVYFNIRIRPSMPIFSSRIFPFLFLFNSRIFPLIPLFIIFSNWIWPPWFISSKSSTSINVFIMPETISQQDSDPGLKSFILNDGSYSK